MSLDNCLVLRLGRARIRWVFEYSHDYSFFKNQILSWALPNALLESPDRDADFTVGVYLVRPALIQRVLALPGTKFMLAGEIEHRYPSGSECFSFVQDPRDSDGPNTRYSPILELWCPPTSRPKLRKCSVVDSGRRPWRAEMISQVARQIGELDISGTLGNRPLAGFHGIGGPLGNDKYLGIQDHAFYLAIERARAFDYITEKFNDAVISEAVPIYSGAPNILDYSIPDSFIPLEEIESIDWNHWEREYERRRGPLLQQKELLRTKFNLLSYFARLVENPSLLGHVRPLTV